MRDKVDIYVVLVLIYFYKLEKHIEFCLVLGKHNLCVLSSLNI